MALTKKYKPGQLVTIDNRVYRVYKARFYKAPCVICEYPKNTSMPNTRFIWMH